MFRGKNRDFAEDGTEGFKGALNRSGFVAILSNYPKCSAEDFAGLDLGEGLCELLGDGGPEVGKLFNNLAARDVSIRMIKLVVS